MARTKFTVTFPAAKAGDQVTWPNTVKVYPDKDSQVPLQPGQSLDETLTLSGWSESASVAFSRRKTDGTTETVTITSASPTGTGPAIPTSAAYLGVASADSRWRPDRTLPALVVGTNGQVLGNPTAVGAAANVTTRSAHAIPTASGDLRLVYANMTSSGNPPVETDPAFTYTIKASVEISGTIYRVLFRGSQSATLDGGGILVSDPIGVDVAAGTVLFVRTYLSTAANWYRNTSLAFPSGFQGGTTTGDLTATGSAAISDSFSFGFMPAAIIGTPYTRTTPSVAILGDSIAAGQGDATQNYAPPGAPTSGYVARALGSTLPFIMAALPSERAQQFAAAAGHYRRLALVNGCTHATENYGTNDIYAGSRTLAQLQADKIALWNACVARGMKVYTNTLTPRTSSTDSWATTGNQTLTSAPGEAIRTAFNDWIRAGAPMVAGAAVAVGTGGAILAGSTGHPLTGYFEVADTVETARNSGLWKVTGAANYATSDGTHPSAAAHALMAAAITPATFTI